MKHKFFLVYSGLFISLDPFPGSASLSFCRHSRPCGRFCPLVVELWAAVITTQFANSSSSYGARQRTNGIGSFMDICVFVGILSELFPLCWPPHDSFPLLDG